MTQTGNNCENWLRGDNSINMQGRIMVLWFCPSPSLPSIYIPFFLDFVSKTTMNLKKTNT